MLTVTTCNNPSTITRNMLTSKLRLKCLKIDPYEHERKQYVTRCTMRTFQTVLIDGDYNIITIIN